MEPIDLAQARSIVFFTGAGMRAESGVPTFRGQNGIWHQYRCKDCTCQSAFDRDPGRVLDLHELRRGRVLGCAPHAGRRHLARLQQALPRLAVITQNIDGLLQRAGVSVDAEFHGSLWRVRCAQHGIMHDAQQGPFRHRRCRRCQSWLLPDMTWFDDRVDATVFARGCALGNQAEVFVSVGTSGAVWPAARFAQQA